MGIASAGTVEVDFAADVVKFNKQLEQVNGKLKSVEGGLTSLESVAKKALGFLSVGVAVNFVKSAAEAADASAKLADKLGLSTERLAAFQLAAEDAGVESATFAKLLTDSQRKLGEAASGTGAAADAIRSLGLRVSDLQKLSPDELFLEYADSIGQLKARSEQFAVAQDLFGKSAQEAFTLIAAGRPAIDEAAATVDKLGLALSRVDAAKIEEANDKLGLLSKTSQAFGQQLAASLAPFATEFVNRLIDAGVAADQTRSKLDEFARAVFVSFEIIANAAKVFDAAVSGVFFAFSKSQEAAMAILRESFEFVAGLDAALGLDTLSKKFTDFAHATGEAEAFAGSLAEQAALRVRNAADSIKSFAQIFDEANQIVVQAQARAEEAAAKQAELNSGLTGESRLETLQFEFDTELEMRQIQEEAITQLMLDQAATRAAALEAIQLDTETRLAEQRLRINQQAEDAIYQVKQDFQNAAIGLLQALATRSKAAALVLIAITKGRAIAEAIMNTEVAATKALGDGDSYSAAARAALIRTMGYASVATIAATGFVEAQNVVKGSSAGAPLGSPQNPVFTSSSSDSGESSQAGATQKPIANITLVGIGEKGLRDLATELSKVLGDYDVRIRREG